MGIPLKLRKIAGLEAVDEAVGRATEMGRPIMFVPGILDMNGHSNDRGDHGIVTSFQDSCRIRRQCGGADFSIAGHDSST